LVKHNTIDPTKGEDRAMNTDTPHMDIVESPTKSTTGGDPHHLEEGARGDVNGGEDNGGDAGVNVVSHMVPNDVPWASLSKMKRGKKKKSENDDDDDDEQNDESVIQTIESMKDACYFLFPDWKVRIRENRLNNIAPALFYFFTCRSAYLHALSPYHASDITLLHFICEISFF
jgi:hypothetical protein